MRIRKRLGCRHLLLPLRCVVERRPIAMLHHTQYQPRKDILLSVCPRRQNLPATSSCRLLTRSRQLRLRSQATCFEKKGKREREHVIAVIHAEERNAAYHLTSAIHPSSENEPCCVRKIRRKMWRGSLTLLALFTVAASAQVVCPPFVDAVSGTSCPSFLSVSFCNDQRRFALLRANADSTSILVSFDLCTARGSLQCHMLSLAYFLLRSVP